MLNSPVGDYDIIDTSTFGTLEKYFTESKKVHFNNYCRLAKDPLHTVDAFETVYEEGVLREKRFYERTLHAIKEFLDGAPHTPVILFDIDETSFSKDIDMEKDYIRPSFLFLIADLKKQYPDVLIGVLSQRRNGPPLSTQHLYSKEFLICSHGHDTTMLSDDSFAFTDTSVRPIYVEKTNAFIELSKKHTDHSFFLIDDILSNDRKTGKNPLVALGHGCAVQKEDRFMKEYQFLGVRC